jgi:hypothetical protein
VKEVKLRWRNMRDCFRKKLHLQKLKKSVDLGTKRRKYMYFEQMKDSNGEEYTDERKEDKQDLSGGTYEISTCRKKQCESNTSLKINYEQQLVDILKERSEHIDVDKTFLLTLVPAFKTPER